MPIQNAKQLPAVYFGLHFAPGVAQYQHPGEEPHCIFINENSCKKMDPTFQGKPVYVNHVDEVDLINLEREIDGVVFDSFYNKADGKHWVRFEVHTDRGHDAIRKGWKLSNAYIPTSRAPGGTWHGVDYKEEIMDGEYEHLAIVDDPRYAESLILTPQEFKAYNEKKEIELKTLANSKEEKPKMGLKLFKRAKVENALDLENTMVELPLSKKEMSVTQIVNELDKVLNMHGYASDDHMVKLNDSEEMSVKDLKACYGKMNEEMKKKNEEESVGQEVAGDDLGEKEDKELYPNAEEKKEEKEEMPAKKNSKENFKKIKEAPKKFENKEEPIAPIYDGIAKGKQLFGSN